MKSNSKHVESIAHKLSTRYSHKKKKYISNRHNSSSLPPARDHLQKSAHDFDIPYLGITSCTQSPTANRRQTMASQTFAVEHFCYRIVKNSSMYGFTPNTKIVPLFEAQLKESNLSGSRGHCP